MPNEKSDNSATLLIGVIIILLIIAGLFFFMNQKKDDTSSNAGGGGGGGNPGGGVFGSTPPYYAGTATDGRTPNPMNPPVTDSNLLSIYNNYVKIMQSLQAGKGSLGYSDTDIQNHYNSLVGAGRPQGYQGVQPLVPPLPANYKPASASNNSGSSGAGLGSAAGSILSGALSIAAVA